MQGPQSHHRPLFLAAFLAGCAATVSSSTDVAAVPVDIAEAIAAPIDAVDPDTDTEAPRTCLLATRDLVVRTAPDPDAEVRGSIKSDRAFEVLAPAAGPGCAAGWMQLPAQGFVCTDHAEPTEQVPVAQPPVVSYDPPEPEEYEQYVATGEYDAGQPVSIVPSVYAKRYRRFKAPLYASLDAWNTGKAPVGHLEGGAGNKFEFTGIVDSERGPVVVREDGKVSPVDQVYLYPISRLRGRDLEADPLAEGLWPAFAIDYAGAPVHEAPDLDSPVHHTLPYHTPLAIRTEPVGGGRWWAVPDALGPGVDGYVNDWRSIRHPVLPDARPSGVADDEVWVGVELNQQAIQLFRGDTLIWFSLTSTGAAPMGTPVGIYVIDDKRATRTMRSRPTAEPEDAYYVEDVPWTMYFKPSYALHASYWHWGFGRTASHGCINLSPQDARTIWERVGPEIPDGWDTARATEGAPGTVLQVWRSGREVPDKR